MNENDNSAYAQDRKVHKPEIMEPDAWRDESRYTRAGNGWTANSWIYTTRNNDGCLAAFITLLVFFFTIVSCGLLGGIGFLFFHIIIAIAGSMIATRKLLSGGRFNIWQWRICNWIVSFLLVFWLAGN